MLPRSNGAEALAPTLEPERKIVAFIDDEASTAALRAGLSALGEALDVRRGGLRQAVRFFRTLAPVSATVIDISGIEDPRTELDELARVCPPDVVVVLIGDNTDIGFYRLVVHDLGANDYMPKPLTRDVVQRLLLPRLSGAAPDLPDARSGHVIAVCGARGGVGATTVAVNAALRLASLAQGQTAVLDLHLRNGTAAMMLGAKPGPGLRIALEEPARSDSLFIERAAITVQPRLRLVAAEDNADPPGAIMPDGYEHVLDLMRHKFNFIFVDLPVPLAPEMKRVLALARNIVVVFQPDLPSLRDVQAIRQSALTTTGSDRVLTVLNRATMRGGLSKELVQRGLGQMPDLVIPDLGSRMIEAINLGEPALQRVPALGRHLMPLVREVAGLRTEPPRSLLRRIIRR
jgi:pilus assembly protein CpaE